MNVCLERKSVLLTVNNLVFTGETIVPRRKGEGHLKIMLQEIAPKGGLVYDEEIRRFCRHCDYFVRNIGVYCLDNLTDCLGTPKKDIDWQAYFARIKYCPCASVNGIPVELFEKGKSVLDEYGIDE